MCGSDEPHTHLVRSFIYRTEQVGANGVQMGIVYIMFCTQYAYKQLPRSYVIRRDIVQAERVMCCFEGGGGGVFDLAFPTVLHHLLLQHPLTSNRRLCDRGKISFVYRRCYVYVIHPDTEQCSMFKTQDEIKELLGLITESTV